jgi:hemerythrin-like domain-containing protein
MDAMTLLRAEHDSLRALLELIADGNGTDERREQVREAAAALILHAQMEERFFYRALEETGDGEVRQSVARARSEHAWLEDVIERVVSMERRDHGFESAVAEFERLALAHLRDDEARLFPLAGRLLSPTELQAIGRAMVEWRARLDAAA